MQDKNTITLTFDDGSEKDFEILFTYQCEERNKNYVFILDGETVGVLEYVETSEGQGNIVPIDPEDDVWEELEDVFESFMEEQENSGCAGCANHGSDECDGCSK